eukprot:gnl/TRDRNA2_/TRDRNA2_126491_c1_seq1.p1 gnl/TRDRNA2_/TRDRNA2_126491_c1~~gnl/TRDRNA2_/TRDRNA2_126491_c1_seq1.p1  ORF type:complete len:412 (+),score=69.85 gnl/TRDRNA2_/TRDRNA2_126491_c1_seq1:100-1236(+)
MLEQAMELFETMQLQGVAPDVATYNVLIRACEKGDKLERALDLFADMKRRGVVPDINTYYSLIITCQNGGDLDMANEIFDEMEQDEDVEVEEVDIAQTEMPMMALISAPSLQPTRPGAAAFNMLRDQGVVRLDRVLSEETSSKARQAVNEQLAVVLADQEDNAAKLGDVLCPKFRYDLLLYPDGGAGEGVLREVLRGPVGELMQAAVGLDAPLYEFAALVSHEGAPRQVLHSDTPFTDDNNTAVAPLFTVFVSLQDVSVEMGPTLYIPGTHTEKAHSEFFQPSSQGEMPATKAALLRRTPFVISTLGAGDCAVYDSRVLHAGTENTAGSRVMLYFTFASPPSSDYQYRQAYKGSIASEARGRYRLTDFLPPQGQGNPA